MTMANLQQEVETNRKIIQQLRNRNRELELENLYHKSDQTTKKIIKQVANVYVDVSF